MAHNLGYELTESEISNFFDFAQGHAAGGESNIILFPNFASAVLSLSGRPTADEIDERSKRLFGFFDADGGGIITVDEMELRLCKMGFDTAGAEQLFVDITGAPQKTIS